MSADMPFSAGIHDQWLEGIRVVSFAIDDHGRADEDAVRRFFGREILGAVHDGERVLIDLAGVPFLDSASLGPLVITLRRLRASGGCLALCHVRAPGLREILALTRFDRIFAIYADREAALRDLASAA